MGVNYNNPIFQRIVQRDPIHVIDKISWTILTLAVITTVGAIWLVLMEYPRAFFRTAPYLFFSGAIILGIMILSITAALLRRDTQHEAHALLFLTNISAERVLWGYMFGSLWRWRVWIALYCWTVWIGGWITSLLFYEQTHIINSYLLASRSFIPPPLLTIGYYGIVWGLFSVGSAFSIVSAGISLGFRGSSPTVGVIRISILSFILNSTLVLLTALLLIITPRITYQLPVVGLSLGSAASIGFYVAHRWQIALAQAWLVLVDVIVGTILGWVIGLFLIISAELKSFGLFLLVYLMLTMLISGQFRLRHHAIFGTRLRVGAWLTIIALVYLRLDERLNFASVMIALGLVAFIQYIYWQLARWQVGKKSPPPRTVSALLWQVGALSASYAIVAIAPDRYTNTYTVMWLAVFGLISWGLTAYAQRGQTQGLIAILTILIQIGFLASALHDTMINNQLQDSRKATFLLNWWLVIGLIGILFSVGNNNIRAALNHIWKQ